MATKKSQKKTGEHPVYDVPEFGSNPVTPATPEPALDVGEKHTTKKKAQKAATWTLQIALVAVPAAISGFASYKNAQVEAEAGYKTMAQAVQELQETTKGLVTQVAYLQGQIDAQKASQPHLKGLQPFIPDKKAPPAPKAEFINLPVDLASAVMAQREALDQASKAKEVENVEKRAAAIEEMKRAQDAAAEKR